MGIFDDISDAVGEAADRVGDAAGDVASGDVGGAVDEIVSGGGAEDDPSSSGGGSTTGSTSGSTGGSSAPSSGGGSTGSSGGGSTGGSTGGGVSVGGSSSSSDSSDFGGGGGSDFDDDGGGSSGGSSSSRSTNSNVNVSGGSSTGTQTDTTTSSGGSTGSGSQTSGGSPTYTVGDERQRVKNRIEDIKQSMQDGTWAANLDEELQQKKDYLQELKQRNPNETFDRTNNVIVSDPDGPGGPKPQKTLGYGDTYSEAFAKAVEKKADGDKEYVITDKQGDVLASGDNKYEATLKARAKNKNYKGNPYGLSEKKIAQYAKGRSQLAEQKIKKAKYGLQQDNFTEYRINASKLSKSEKKKIGLSPDASGTVKVSQGALSNFYGQKIEEINQNQQSYNNFIQEYSQAQKNSEAEKQAAKKKTGLFPSAEKLAERSREGAQIQRKAKNQMVDILKEDPELSYYAAKYPEAPKNYSQVDPDVATPDQIKTKKELKKKMQKKGITLDEIRKYNDAVARSGLSRGEKNELEGRVQSSQAVKNNYKKFGAQNPIVNTFFRGVEVTSSFAKEAVQFADSKIPDPKKGSKNTYVKSDGFRNKETIERYGTAESIDIPSQKSDSLQYKGDPIKLDRSPENPNKASLQDALTYSEKRADELSNAFGKTFAGATYGLPGEIQKRGGQLQQLASGEMTVDEAIRGTKQSVGQAAKAAKKDPVKFAAGLAGGAIVGGGISKLARGVGGRAFSSSDFDSRVSYSDTELLKKNDQTAVGRGKAKVATKKDRKILPGSKKYETNVKLQNVQSTDSSTYATAKAETIRRGLLRDKKVSENEYFLSSFREAPQDYEGRVGEAAVIRSKVGKVGGREEQLFRTDSVLANKIDDDNFNEYVTQTARSDSDRGRNRARVYDDSDSAGSTFEGSAVRGDSGGGSRYFQLSRKGGEVVYSPQGAPLRYISESNIRGSYRTVPKGFGGAVAGGATGGATATSGGSEDTTQQAAGGSTQQTTEAATRPGETGQIQGVEGSDVFIASPGRPTVGPTSGQAETSQSGGDGVLTINSRASTGSGVFTFTGNKGEVVNVNEREMQQQKQEFGSRVINLAALNAPAYGRGQTEEKNEGGRRGSKPGKGKGRGKAAPTSSPGQQQRPQRGSEPQGRGERGPPSGVVDNLMRNTPATPTNVATASVINAANRGQTRTEKMVKQRRGGQGQDQKVMPQGLIDTYTEQRNEVTPVNRPEQVQRQGLTPVQTPEYTTTETSDPAPPTYPGLVTPYPRPPGMPKPEAEPKEENKGRRAGMFFIEDIRRNPTRNPWSILTGQSPESSKDGQSLNIL